MKSFSDVYYATDYYKRRVSDYFEHYCEAIDNTSKMLNDKIKKYEADLRNSLLKNLDIEDSYEMFNQIVLAETDYYRETTDLFKMNICGGFVVGLYHIWEQQIKSFLHFIYNIDIYKNANYRVILNTYKAQDVDLEKIRGCGKINELRRLANMLKHGDGEDKEKLEGIKPELFKVEDDYWMPASYENEEYNYCSTLNEISVVITKEYIEEYKNALLEFWSDIPSYLFS